MERCVECNKEIYEETPYCEDCMERQIREEELKFEEMQAAMNEAGKECELLKQEYDHVLDRCLDRKISNRFQYMRMLPQLIKARDAYITAVIYHFDESCLDDHCRSIYESNKSLYQ